MTAPLFLRGSSPEDGIFSLVREHLAYFSPGVFILYTYLSISTEYCPSFTTKTDPLIEKGLASAKRCDALTAVFQADTGSDLPIKAGQKRVCFNTSRMTIGTGNHGSSILTYCFGFPAPPEKIPKKKSCLAAALFRLFTEPRADFGSMRLARRGRGLASASLCPILLIAQYEEGVGSA